VGSHHKATGSLGSAFPSTTLILPVTDKPISPLKLVETDHSATSLEEVLTPQTTNSLTRIITDTCSENAFTISNDYVNNAFVPATQTANQLPAGSTSVDPWASADFSFFETTTTPFSKAPPTPTTKTIPPTSVTFNAPAATSIPQRNQKSREEIERDRIVQSIIKGLPDLSYMLRRSP
jgi:hypothetical protein